MADMKEKLELIDVICYAMRDWDDYMDECRETETPPIDSFEDYIADNVISAGYRKQEWISVKDRLPEAGKKVICCGSEGGLFVARTRECAGRVLIIDNKRAVQRKATHWMPLPQPPKGE